MPPTSHSLAERSLERFAELSRLAGDDPAFRYEDRPSQRLLAADIAATLEHGGVLLAEGPTGIGKSLAYLLPAVLMAERGRRVVVATCTRSLQDQLYTRDIPLLLDRLGISIEVACLKGKQNYVCPGALGRVTADGAEEEETLAALRAWAERDRDGDLDRFPADDPEAFARLRGRVAADPSGCTTRTCRQPFDCFWVRARRAARAPLVIVNHALLAVANDVDGILPEFDALIVDEAHRLEGVLLSQLERGVSRGRFDELLRRVGARGRRTGSGMLVRLEGVARSLFTGGTESLRSEIERLERRVPEASAAVDVLFGALGPRSTGRGGYPARARYRSLGEVLGSDLDRLDVVLTHAAAFARSFDRLASAFEGVPGEQTLAIELAQAGLAWNTAAMDLDRLANAADREWVYWRTTGGRGTELHGAPVGVGGHARTLFGRSPATVLTSATLSVAGDLGFIAERLGMGESWGVPYSTSVHPSPFDLDRQMISFLYDSGRAEAEAVADLVVELHAATRRNQLVLFTAHERLKRARALLLDRLPADAVLLAQEWDGTAGILSDRFRAARGAILLGVQSLWEGVDFPGDALEIVIVAKLPFSVPDDPRVEARAERLRERGLDPFVTDALPEAALRFRQGIGRLIRRADDRGVLVVCDPRLSSASYRRAFVECLPGTPVRAGDAREVAQAAARFLGVDAVVEESA